MATSLKRKAVVDLAEADAKKPKANGSITSFFGQPKASLSTTTGTKPAVAEPAPIKFDKEAWIATLTPEQKELLQLEMDTLHDSWLAALHPELTKPSFLSLKRFLTATAASGAKIFPPLADVYSWSRHTPLGSVKAVILGQDPYHNLGQAHGLCFSVRPPVKAPPSLKNMYIALKRDYPNTFRPPPDGLGLLTPWADQGVLMLNTCLTVTAHSANSHAGKGWEDFTQKIIDLVAKRSRGVVFLAWGSPAQKRCKDVSGAKHLVLKSVHPSPLSAHRGFLDCGHFKRANEWLREKYGVEGEIDWNLDIKPEEAGV